MGKSDVLNRVAADLARGHTQPAIQRLASLVSANPTDLDLRRRLAAVHRMVGNRIEAGRWTYLHPDADQAEIAAFERAYPAADVRLRELRWRDRPGRAATDYARARLEELTEAVGDDRRSRPSPPATTAGPLPMPSIFVIIATVAVLTVAIIGAVTVAQWI